MKTQQPVWTAEKLQAVSPQIESESEISALSPADQLAWCVSKLAVLVPAMSQLREAYEAARDSDLRACDMVLNVSERHRVSIAAFSSCLEQLEQKP
tara:strand:- start:723 stop:1010 length:288 start_codon:yes stop_codon:yes gene_type:complete